MKNKGNKTTQEDEDIVPIGIGGATIEKKAGARKNGVKCVDERQVEQARNFVIENEK